MITIQSHIASLGGFIIPSWNRVRFGFVSWDKWDGVLTLEEKSDYKKPVNTLPYIGATGLIEYS